MPDNTGPERPPIPEPRPEPPPAWREVFVEAGDGTRLYVRTRPGPGPLTFLLCDGIACDGFIWRYLADDLLRFGSVVHWNYRGHGRSAAPVNRDLVDIHAFVDDLNVVWRAHVSGDVVLVGHSMGCQLALEGYRHRPSLVAGLILICGTSGRLTHTFKGGDGLARALPGLIERVQQSPRLARALWSNVPPEVSVRFALAAGEVDANAIQPEDLKRYSEHVAALDLEMFLRMLHAVGEQTAEDMLGTVAVPALVLAGEQDTFTPTYLAERMAAAIPKSELTIYPGATHVVPIERREAVRDRIHQFVEQSVLPGLGPILD